MKITKLTLKNFRNHRFFQITPHPLNNFFTGDNGQGKTSILEAVSLILDGRSFRQGSHWIQQEKSEAKIFISLQHSLGEDECCLILSNQQKPQYLVNGRKKKNPFKKEAVFVTSRDLFSIREDSSHRRKLMDDLVSYFQPKAVRDFKEVLVQKNRFLKLCKKGFYSAFDQKKLLQSLNLSFFEKAKTLIRYRLQELASIEPYWREQGELLFNTSDFQNLYISGGKETPNFEKATRLLANDMERLEGVEKAQGICLAGPHRHDLMFFLRKKEARASLSGGEQKAILLSWKMAHWKWLLSKKEQPPPLFLDDIFSEIDQHFIKNLLRFLLENEAQNFVTATKWTTPFHPNKGTIFDLGVREHYDINQSNESNQSL